MYEPVVEAKEMLHTYDNEDTKRKYCKYIISLHYYWLKNPYIFAQQSIEL